ncbi:MAG: hypothetical protein KF776_13910 [Burkholderiales bacterium]|nr:hypothetical protein [Burkholderiales bacterium]
MATSKEPVQERGCLSGARKLNSLSFPEVVVNPKWVVGFSLRIGDRDALTGAWDAERRARYSLRQDISYSLSFDELVWPKCGSAEMWGKCFAEPVSASLDQDGCDFVEDMMNIRDWRSIPNENELTQGCCLVAIIAPTHLRLLEGPSKAIAQAIGDRLDSMRDMRDWSILGFDVVESCLGLSGLSNTSYSAEEHKSLSSVFATEINSHGLLSNIDAALRFADATNRRVMEHAPFVPVALAAFRCSL